MIDNYIYSTDMSSKNQTIGGKIKGWFKNKWKLTFRQKDNYVSKKYINSFHFIFRVCVVLNGGKNGLGNNGSCDL